MKTNIELAREAGGTAYTNRHIDGSAFAFGLSVTGERNDR